MIAFAQQAKNGLPTVYLTGHVTSGDGDVAPKGRGAQNAPNLGAASLGESGRRAASQSDHRDSSLFSD